jgi:hypothetical protein
VVNRATPPRIAYKAKSWCQGNGRIDSARPEPKAPCPEIANHKLDQQVLFKKGVMFSNVVKIIPRQSLTKSPSEHDLHQAPQVEAAPVDLDMTSKTNFVQPNDMKVVSHNETTAPKPYISLQEQEERGHDETIIKTWSVFRLCTLGYTVQESVYQ